MTARAMVTEVVKAAMPGWVDVMGYARQIDPPARPTVMVRVDEVTRPSDLPIGCRVYKFALVCVAALTDHGGAADDELDVLLEDVLHALDSAPALTWDTATRAVYAETNPAFEVIVTVTTKEN